MLCPRIVEELYRSCLRRNRVFQKLLATQNFTDLYPIIANLIKRTRNVLEDRAAPMQFCASLRLPLSVIVVDYRGVHDRRVPEEA